MCIAPFHFHNLHKFLFPKQKKCEKKETIAEMAVATGSKKNSIRKERNSSNRWEEEEEEEDEGEEDEEGEEEEEYLGLAG